MSCNDPTPPCDQDSPDDDTGPTTYCDRDRTHNSWILSDSEAPETGEGGICLLDTLSECQVVNSLQRDEKARADLLRVTSNEYLLNLARTVPRLSTERPGDKLQTETNKNSESIPFYSQFRGNPPFNQ